MKKLLFVLCVFTVFITANAQKVSINGNKSTISRNVKWLDDTNIPWHLFYDVGRSDINPAWWEDEFEHYVKNHINHTPVLIRCSGDVNPDIYETGYISGTNDEFCKHKNHLIEVSRNNQISVMPALTSFDILKDSHNICAQ